MATIFSNTVGTDETLKTALDRADPNVLADILRSLGFGDMVRALPTYLRGQNPNTNAADPSVLGTLQSLLVPEDARAVNILRATARAGTAAAGELSVQAFGTTPSTGQIAVAPNGQIVVLASDAWTNLDVVYTPEKGDLVVGLTLTVASNVATIPTAYTGNPPNVILLLAANATTATATGQKIILVPGSGAPSAGQCRLNLAKTTITFASADAVTQCSVDLLVSSAIDVNALLEGINVPNV